MELMQLKYFQKVAKLEHMTRAAQELHIAQPALSKNISMLEKELGVSLFDRRGKYIYLNQYGKAFLKRVDQALALLENGKQELNNLAGMKSGTIRLAVLAASNLLPNILSAFRSENPYISFDLVQHLKGALTKSDFELCISSSLIHIDGIHRVPLVREEIFLAVPVDHSLADRESIHLSEVADEDFICLKPGQSLREITDNFCHSVGFSPRIIFESDDPSTVRGLIRAGQGISFIPEITWGGAEGAAMKLLHISEPVCERTIWLYYVDDLFLSQSAKEFRQFIIDFFAKLADC